MFFDEPTAELFQRVLMRSKELSALDSRATPGLAAEESKDLSDHMTKAATALRDRLAPALPKGERRRVDAEDLMAATKAYHEFRKEVLEGVAKPEPPAPPMTLRTYVERYWPAMKTHVGPRTVRLETDTIEKRLLPIIGDVQLAKITGPVVRDLVGTLRRDGYTTRKGERRSFSPESINLALRVLRKLLRDAVERGEVAVYPIRGRLPLERAARLELELTRGARGVPPSVRRRARLQGPHRLGPRDRTDARERTLLGASPLRRGPHRAQRGGRPLLRAVSLVASAVRRRARNRPLEV